MLIFVRLTEHKSKQTLFSHVKVVNTLKGLTKKQKTKIIFSIPKPLFSGGIKLNPGGIFLNFPMVNSESSVGQQF